MSLDPISSILSIGEAAIKRIWPDPVKQAEEQRKLVELAQKSDLAELDAHVKLMLGQLEINKAEAQHKSVYVAGARPFIIWVGGVALAYQFVLYPLLLWVWAAFGLTISDAPPVIDSAALWTLLTGLLGIGGMRSFDKTKGTQTDCIKKPS